MKTHFESALAALGIDPRHAADGVRAKHPLVPPLIMSAEGFRFFTAYRDTKTPGFRDWQFLASSDPLVLAGWYKKLAPPNPATHWYPLAPHSELNMLVLTGRAGKLWLIDIDGEQGRADLATLESELGPLPQTWTVESGRIGGGEHRWFRPTPNIDPELMNQQHMFGYSIDVRAWHGYAVCPGSTHAETHARYRWREGCAPGEIEMAELPPAWLEYLPKKVIGECASVTTRSRSVCGLRLKREHDPASLLVGDGPGFGGFDAPLYRNAIQFFFSAGTDAPAVICLEMLREIIAEAPKGPGRNVSRYMTGNDLPRVVERARSFVQQVKESESVEFGYE
ncbi:MAG: bifunctional DNA primase/polymerase [Alphaproteobacteria bacterium]|nr:bifunctional DNA primase/polymerase [Alphaproteobacteria bacterium]